MSQNMITTLTRRSVSVRQATCAAAMSPRRARAHTGTSPLSAEAWFAQASGAPDVLALLADPGQRSELAAEQQLSRAESKPAPALAVAIVVLPGCWGDEGSGLGITSARGRRDD